MFVRKRTNRAPGNCAGRVIRGVFIRDVLIWDVFIRGIFIWPSAFAGVSGLAGLAGPGVLMRSNRQGRAGDDRDGDEGRGPDAGEGSGFGPENAENAQHSGEDGVPDDMATLVLNNPALGKAAEAEARFAASHPAADPASDAAIMLRVAAGDDSGFNFLVGKYHRSMVSFLYRMVHNQSVAEELAQEVFLRVYRSREGYRAEAKFTTWLYRIATNLAVNHARDTRHERAAQNVYLDAPDEETGTTPEVADDRPSVEQRLLKDERMAAIRLHVMALPERQRMAVLMHKYQGLDYKQIGEVLKLSESATKSLLFRAYQTLRERLKDFV
jgi:RNA polymerase sigma-70 factor (ECF subfamily)